MTECPPIGPSAPLNQLLGQWRDMVQLVADKRCSPERREEPAYQTLHARLVETCRDAATAVGNDDQQRQSALQLQQLVQPWVTLEALQEAGPGILRDLLAKCAAGHDAAAPASSATPAASYGALVFVGIFIFAVALGIGAGGDLTGQLPSALSSTESIRVTLERCWDELQESRSQVATYGLGALAVAFTGAVAFWVLRPPSNC